MMSEQDATWQNRSIKISKSATPSLSSYRLPAHRAGDADGNGGSQRRLGEVIAAESGYEREIETALSPEALK